MVTKDRFGTLKMRRERVDSGSFQVDAAASSEQLGEAASAAELPVTVAVGRKKKER